MSITTPSNPERVDRPGPHSRLAHEWHCVCEASARARADYRAVAADPSADLEGVDRARERYERSEALRSRLLDQLDRLAFSTGSVPGN